MSLITPKKTKKKKTTHTLGCEQAGKTSAALTLTSSKRTQTGQMLVSGAGVGPTDSQYVMRAVEKGTISQVKP